MVAAGRVSRFWSESSRTASVFIVGCSEWNFPFCNSSRKRVGLDVQVIILSSRCRRIRGAAGFDVRFSVWVTQYEGRKQTSMTLGTGMNAA